MSFISGLAAAVSAAGAGGAGGDALAHAQAVEIAATEHLRLTGTYWGLAALALLRAQPQEASLSAAAPAESAAAAAAITATAAEGAAAAAAAAAPGEGAATTAAAPAEGAATSTAAPAEGAAALSPMSVRAIVELVRACACPEGGWAGAPGHDAHLLHSLSALQVRRARILC